jgi:hypothetical protein
VAVTTNITDLQAFLQHIITHTNMTCLNAADDAMVRTLYSPYAVFSFCTCTLSWFAFFI